jgi:septum site-determining protein MinC
VQTVTIKSNRNGINLILDPAVSFDVLEQAVRDKFTESARFFQNAELVLSFAGRELSEEEEQILIRTITEVSGARILFLLEQDEFHEALIGSRIEAFRQAGPEETAGDHLIRAKGYFQGTLQAGDILESRESVLICGNVEPGAQVMSMGNVVVLGTLAGTACAGIGGNDRCFAAAMEMMPERVTIGDASVEGGPAPEKRGLFRRKPPEGSFRPQMAVRSGDQVVYRSITKQALEDLYQKL